MHRYQITFISN